MRDVNKVILVGRLGADPLRRETKTGSAVTHLSVATSRLKKKGQNPDDPGEKERETTWHRVVAWGKQAENCKRYLKKGELVYVEGELRSSRYEKEGVERVSFEVYARDVRFISPGKRPAEDAVTFDGPYSIAQSPPDPQP